MFGSQILEVVIGMALIYLLFALLLSAAREMIEALLKTRAVDLEKALAGLLRDATGTADRTTLMNHPLVFSLFPGDYTPSPVADANKARNWKPVENNTPSYIPGSVFADAMIDLYRQGTLTASADVMAMLLRSAGGDVDAWRASIIHWYDAAMDRATGWYKRRTQGVLFGLGLALAIGMNVNSATLVQHLATNDALRTKLVAAAEAQVKAGKVERPAACNDATDQPKTACVQALNASIQGLNLPIGWGAEGFAPWQRIGKGDILSGFGQLLFLTFGILATALAMCLGAPFWFDLLNKLVNLRSTLKPAAEPESPPKAAGAGTTPAPTPAANAVPPPADAPALREHHADEALSLQPAIYG